ncbi:hypothetical protein EDEG_03710 [Edhazardia aedis USNM 41457]|uniref:Transmembrane protein n=1 Tax=Edhazardia aedis (strain USNM 41457) TaxID=1003232 RepID=J9DKA1_EDHAE|nr:hypothetical protein EDEG_03710 [Edhazardia aedis USNM 41457]|eukprot:EJW01802.1 hypothetical protein EDEG_03710 [Edhazardia aedis USNM 41457]
MQEPKGLISLQNFFFTTTTHLVKIMGAGKCLYINIFCSAIEHQRNNLVLTFENQIFWTQQSKFCKKRYKFTFHISCRLYRLILKYKKFIIHLYCLTFYIYFLLYINLIDNHQLKIYEFI